MLSDYTLWHRRMGHAHQHVNKASWKTTWKVVLIKPLMHHLEHVMDTKKSKRLPFPTSKYRAKQPLDLVHSALDKIPVLSISRYKYTTAYLDDHSSYGVMFYLKNKSKEFTTFKIYKAWAKRQLVTTLKCRQFNHGGEFLSNEQKTYMADQMSMPDSPQQNG